MFCSVKCRDLTYKHVEKFEWLVSDNIQNIRYERILSDVEEAFGGHERLLKFIQEQANDFKKTVFDYDFTIQKHAKMNSIKSLLSLISKGNKNALHRISEAARSVAKGNTLIENFIKNLALILEGLTRKDEEKPVDVLQFFPFCGLINHKCDSNIATLEVEDALILYATKPIKSREQLFINSL